MVYVVERYLPGLHRSDLLRGLLRLEQGSEEGNRGANVRYLDSTRMQVVLGSAARMHGMRIRAENKDGAKTTYFSYQRTSRQGASAPGRSGSRYSPARRSAKWTWSHGASMCPSN